MYDVRLWHDDESVFVMNRCFVSVNQCLQFILYNQGNFGKTLYTCYHRSMIEVIDHANELVVGIVYNHDESW
jgi:hypothetical protein